MIVVTGAAGVTGSYLIQRLNQDNFNAIIAVDKFNNEAKDKNPGGSKIKECVDRYLFFNWLDKNYETVEFIFHLGTLTDSTEFDLEVHSLNTEYSKAVWKRCCQYQIPLVYASPAVTTGGLGYDDSQDFDIWALRQPHKPFFWAGLFFDVYGSKEPPAGGIDSTIRHAYKQILQADQLKLIKPNHPDYKDGAQKRDFIYVKEIVEACMFFMHHRKNSGIFNLGQAENALN